MWFDRQSIISQSLQDSGSSNACSSSHSAAEHRVKEQSLKHESPLSGADDFTLLVESDSKLKGIVEELLDVQSLLAYAVDMPSKAVEAHAMVTKLLPC